MRRFPKGGGLGIVVMVIIAAVAVYLAKHHKSSDSYKHSLPELNEQGTKQWSDADKYLLGQIFTINTNQDTVIQTKGGLVVAVPANCFLGEDGKPVTGPVELEMKEALDASSMMRAGLSTKSGSDLLESAGMFYLNGRQDGKSLKMDSTKGIYVHVPADTIKTGMQTFEGKRMPDGTIDWVNPKPLVHNLVPVNIHTLNFYPPLYLDSLAMWGKNVKNKKYTDSLYYSFASMFGDHTGGDRYGGTQSYPTRNLEDGAKLFKANCAMCHSLGSNRITGAGLEGVSEKVPQPYAAWLLKYIKNNVVVRKSGDAYANKIGAGMTVFENVLTDEQINDIISFLATTRLKADTCKDYHRPFDERNTNDSFPLCGINPAKIKAIWNDKFQNTLISTKEFEERMPYIHETGNEAILDLYVNNLNKNLCHIDSLAAAQLDEDMKNTFLSFAARGDGKVAVKSSLFEKLKAFYEKKARLFTEAAAKVQNEFEEKQNKEDTKADKKEEKHVNTDTIRSNHMRGDEYKINLKDACRQVGDPDSNGRVDKNGYAVLCTGPGWINLDAYVWASTYTRTTLNYTSPKTGKMAIIRYLPFSISVHDYSTYDNVFVYLLPNKLNSFMRINYADGIFKENLNELFSYGLECVAYKGNQAYYYSMDKIEPKAYDGLVLMPVSARELDKELNKYGNKNQRDDMEKEVEFMKFATEDKLRRKKNEETENFRKKLELVIFKCWQEQSEEQGGGQPPPQHADTFK